MAKSNLLKAEMDNKSINTKLENEKQQVIY